MRPSGPKEASVGNDNWFDALPLDVWDSRGTSVPLGARLVDVASWSIWSS